jgi:hypothetical protein
LLGNRREFFFVSEAVEQARQRLIELIEMGCAVVPIDPRTTPHKWWFGRVLDPRTGQCFTYAGAWDFILEKLKKGHRLREKPLRKPPDGKGYVLLVRTAEGKIYIKLQLGHQSVIGRSFHYSGE